LTDIISTAPDLKHVDLEPYFARWNSVLFYPNPDAPENEIPLVNHSGGIGSIVCHQHRGCDGLVKIDGKRITKYPPRVCPICGSDTATEVTPEILQQFNDLLAGKIEAIP
jgi:hypothetical protein